MRGGARWGAGRPGGKIKIETLLHIDVHQWAVAGALVPGTRFISRWRRGDEDIGSIVASMTNRDFLTLQIRFSPDASTEQSIFRSLQLTYTPCHYGGQRVWFRCPHCSRRAAKLYLVRGQWYCRRSLNLAYASQSMNAVDRIHHHIAKLQSRLDEDGEKPKGMHWRTYDHIIERCNEADNALAAACSLRWGRMF